MTRVTYIGQLVAVRLDDGKTVEVEVRPIGVTEHDGLVIAQNRRELARGIIYARPKGPTIKLAAFFYRRRRDAGSDLWEHEAPGAFVVLVRGKGKKRPFCYIESKGARRCGPGDFVCGS